METHPPTNGKDEICDPVAWDEYGKANFWVGKEVRKPQGQLDILLEADSHVLVIENKIWAAEGGMQVARYAEYIESQQRKAGQVLYLTLDGKQAFSHGGKNYLRISYDQHILDWLERCLAATYKIIPVNQVLIQYKHVVEQLTNHNLEASTMDMIKAFLRDNPQVISHLNAVNQATEKLRIEVLENFAKALILRLSDRYHLIPRADMRGNSFGQDANGSLKIRAKDDDITTGHPFEIWIEHASLWKALLIGIETKWKKVRELSNDEVNLMARMREKLLVHCTQETVHHGTATQTWKGTHWPLSWHGLFPNFMEDNEALSQMLSPEVFDRTVEMAAQKVHDYMELLKRFYKESQP